LKKIYILLLHVISTNFDVIYLEIINILLKTDQSNLTFQKKIIFKMIINVLRALKITFPKKYI